MKLIADSGSTKTQWSIQHNNQTVKEILTGGINPYQQTEEEIEKIIVENLVEELISFSLDSIHFYGAGCAYPEKKELLKRIFQKHFNIAEISVESDMLAAARALFHNESGIACILGTGSNSCLYDGKDIVQNVPALGFILGDEGSGAVLGKRLVSDVLKNQLPKEIQEKFLEQYKLDAPTVLNKVYKEPFPNRFLAGLSLFLLENIENPVLYNIVYEEFTQFTQRNLYQYPYKEYEAGFIGSVAFYFSNVLKKVCQENEIRIKGILQRPMDGLTLYHSQN